MRLHQYLKPAIVSFTKFLQFMFQNNSSSSYVHGLCFSIFLKSCCYISVFHACRIFTQGNISVVHVQATEQKSDVKCFDSNYTLSFIKINDCIRTKNKSFVETTPLKKPEYVMLPIAGAGTLRQ